MTHVERDTGERLADWIRMCVAAVNLVPHDEAFGAQLAEQLNILHGKGYLATAGELAAVVSLEVDAVSAAANLKRETVVLADALGKLTHEHVPMERFPTYCRVCTRRVDDPRHHTPAWLRTRYGFGA